MTRWHEPAPGEREAGERTLEVVRSAYAERLPAPPARNWRPAIAVAVVVALFAAAFTAPGGALRDAVQGKEDAEPALFALPAPGRLLVNSAQGAWIVERDGSKRLLAGYREASWSPHGLFLAAVRGHELHAIEPDGDVRWSVGRRAISLPRWSSAGGGDERIAYLSRNTLRVIGGDRRGDRLVSRNVARIAAAWLPGTHVLAYADRRGRVVVRNADTGSVQRVLRPPQRPLELEWSRTRNLLVRGATSITIFGQQGERLQPIGGPGAAAVTDATFSPDGRQVASVQRAAGRSSAWVYPRLRADGTAAKHVFTGAGRFARILWSPNRRWLLLDWDSADQWLFISANKVTAVSNVELSFGPAATPAGWCCP